MDVGDVGMVRLDAETEVRATWTGDYWRGEKGGIYDPALLVRALDEEPS
jgi:hypothetical protein